MINLPDPPEGYRWKVKPCPHDHWSSRFYHDIDVCLQKRTLGIWWSDHKDCVKKSSSTHAQCVLDTANSIMVRYHKLEAARKEKESLYGVYKSDEK